MKKKQSIKFLTLFSAIAIIATTGLAAQRALAQEMLFTGVVVKKDVQIRAGAGSRYYVVGQVKKGQEVKVKDVIFGWNKIASPQGVYSYIKKSAVSANSDKTAAKVTTSEAKVIAANIKGAQKSYRQQLTLSKGQSVKIVGEDGDYYKIVSPKNSFVFLPPGSVRRENSIHATTQPSSTDKHKTSTGESNNSNSAPTTQPQTKPSSATTKPTAPKQSAQPNKTKVNTLAKSEALKKVEIKMLPWFSKPVSEQPLDKMQTAYKKVASNSDLSKWDQKIVAVRLAMISRNQKIADTLAHIQKITQQIKQSEEKQSKSQKNIQPHYDLVGYLKVSKIYDGQSLPRLYRITDSNGYTLAYVNPKLIHSHKMLGHLVGITGKKQHNQTLNLDIFNIKQINILRD